MAVCRGSAPRGGSARPQENEEDREGEPDWVTITRENRHPLVAARGLRPRDRHVEERKAQRRQQGPEVRRCNRSWPAEPSRMRASSRNDRHQIAATVSVPDPAHEGGAHGDQISAAEAPARNAPSLVRGADEDLVDRVDPAPKRSSSGGPELDERRATRSWLTMSEALVRAAERDHRDPERSRTARRRWGV